MFRLSPLNLILCLLYLRTIYSTFTHFSLLRLRAALVNTVMNILVFLNGGGGLNSGRFLIYLRLKNERPTWCHLLFCFTSCVLNMFRTLIYPSSGACDCVVELSHRSSCSQCVVFWGFGAAGFGWCSFCRLKHNLLCFSLMMDILMSETCWAHKKWNKIASDNKLVFHSLTIKIYCFYLPSRNDFPCTWRTQLTQFTYIT